jgi:hypothetical protein
MHYFSKLTDNEYRTIFTPNYKKRILTKVQLTLITLIKS